MHTETEKSSQKTVAKLLSVEGLIPRLPHGLRASIDQGLVSRVSNSDGYLMSQSHPRRHRTLKVRLYCSCVADLQIQSSLSSSLSSCSSTSSSSLSSSSSWSASSSSSISSQSSSSSSSSSWSSSWSSSSSS